MTPLLEEVRPGVPTDAQLIRVSGHDPVAFEAVFERHFDLIHRYLARRVGGQLADELAAETFAVAFAKRRRYDGAQADARPWLYGIAARLVGRHRRSELRALRAYARSGVDPFTPDHSHDAAGAASARAAGPALAAALAELQPGDRDVLLLFAWGELGYRQIAQALDLPVGTVRSRLSRARRLVSGQLDDHLREEAQDG